MTNPSSNSGPLAPSAETAAGNLARTLIAHEVDTVYCLPGEETIALLEAIAEVGIELVVTRHEQHAAFMASAHGRFTGKPGIVITTLGPGMTNSITGLAQAHLCGFPVVAICGQKPSQNNDEGSFQVLDLPALARPVTKWAHRVSDPGTVAADTSRALLTAVSPRPGPVLLEIPEDIAGGPSQLHHKPTGLNRGVPVASPEQIARVQTLIANAETPVVLAGGGTQIGNIPNALAEFASKTGIGVVATQMGKGSLPEDHPQSLRSMSLNSGDFATRPLERADLILAVGFQPVEHPPSSFNPDDAKRIVHIDSATPEIERHYQPFEVGIGDISVTLRALAAFDQPDANARSSATAKQRAEIEKQLQSEARPESFPPSAPNGCRALAESLGPRGHCCPRQWCVQGVVCPALRGLRPQHSRSGQRTRNHGGWPSHRNGGGQTSSGSQGGCGVRRRRVHDELAGSRNRKADGARQRHGSSPQRRHLRLIAWHQDEQGHKRTAVNVANPDFEHLAKAFGVRASKVSAGGDLDAVLTAAIGGEQLNLIECPLDQSRNDELK